jgi:hypothetical protein
MSITYDRNGSLRINPDLPPDAATETSQTETITEIQTLTEEVVKLTDRINDLCEQTLITNELLKAFLSKI